MKGLREGGSKGGKCKGNRYDKVWMYRVIREAFASGWGFRNCNLLLCTGTPLCSVTSMLSGCMPIARNRAIAPSLGGKSTSPLCRAWIRCLPKSNAENGKQTKYRSVSLFQTTRRNQGWESAYPVWNKISARIVHSVAQAWFLKGECHVAAVGLTGVSEVDDLPVVSLNLGMRPLKLRSCFACCCCCRLLWCWPLLLLPLLSPPPLEEEKRPPPAAAAPAACLAATSTGDLGASAPENPLQLSTTVL